MMIRGMSSHNSLIIKVPGLSQLYHQGHHCIQFTSSILLETLRPNTLWGTTGVSLIVAFFHFAAMSFSLLVVLRHLLPIVASFISDGSAGLGKCWPSSQYVYFSSTSADALSPPKFRPFASKPNPVFITKTFVQIVPPLQSQPSYLLSSSL